MDEQRLAAILESYGGDPARWPADEREPALRLLARSPGLQALQREELLLDGALDEWTVAAPSAALVGSVLPRPATARPPGLLPRAAAWLARPLAAMTVAGAIAVAGMMTGYAIPQDDTSATASTDLLASEVSELILPSTEWASLQ